MNRIDGLRQRLVDQGCEAFLVSDIKNIRYLTGFTGSSAYLLMLKDRAIFITDSRYELQSKNQVDPGCEIVIHREGIVKELKRLLSGVKTLGFEPENITYSTYSALEENLSVKLRPVPRVVYEMRKRKSSEEVDQIAAAQTITDAVFNWVLENLEPGKMTEAELALEMEYQMRKMGADGPAFGTIVATGPHSALPHATPRDVIIGTNTVLLMDFGAQKAYASDMTRTVWIGPERPPDEFKKIYDIVAKAQSAGEEVLAPGVACKQVDEVARKIIRDAGYGEQFGHSLGHGVGLNVHEMPRLSALSEEVLEGNEVVTVEPGIYLEGKFGVRIEDMLWVKEGGSRLLTNSPKELIII